MNGRPISKLDGISSLQEQDKFLISEYNISSDSLYYTRSIRFENLKYSVSSDFSVSSIRESADINISMTKEVSSSYLSVRTDTDEFAEKFENNEISTRMIPRLSADTIHLSNQLSDVLDTDMIYYPKRDQTNNIPLSLFAKNFYETSYPIMKFRIPDFMEGYSRHVYLILNIRLDSWIFFSADREMTFFSNRSLDRIMERGTWMLDIKEIEKDVFFINQNRIENMLEQDFLVGSEEARQEPDEDGNCTFDDDWFQTDGEYAKRMGPFNVKINSIGDQS